MFGLDSPLGLFPPGMDHGKLYSPLMEMSDPRGMHDQTPFLKKKSKFFIFIYNLIFQEKPKNNLTPKQKFHPKYHFILFWF